MKILRKAQIEVSFNWIFILIAGGIILLFFIMIARNHEKNTSNETANIILVKLQTLFSAIQQNPDAVQKQDNIKVELEFDCEENRHVFTVKGSDTKAYLDSEILFTPKTVGDSKTIAWTQLYSSPYPVVQVLYFTDEETQYIFETSAREYYNKFPEQFERNLSSKAEIESLQDHGFRKYVIVTGPVELVLDDSSMKRKSTIIRVGENRVEIIYNNNYANAVSVPYVNDATLFGAIISGDDKLYGCTMDKIMYLSKVVGEINLERIKSISNELLLTPDNDCNLFFAEVPGLPQSYIDGIIGESIYSKTGDYADLKKSIADLEGINDAMARSNCPMIY